MQMPAAAVTPWKAYEQPYGKSWTPGLLYQLYQLLQAQPCTRVTPGCRWDVRHLGRISWDLRYTSLNVQIFH